MVQLQAVQLKPNDLINNPLTIEFLGLNDRALVTESDLEQALLDHLREFFNQSQGGPSTQAGTGRISLPKLLMPST